MRIVCPVCGRQTSTKKYADGREVINKHKGVNPDPYQSIEMCIGSRRPITGKELICVTREELDNNFLKLLLENRE